MRVRKYVQSISISIASGEGQKVYGGWRSYREFSCGILAGGVIMYAVALGATSSISLLRCGRRIGMRDGESGGQGGLYGGVG